MLWHYFHFLDYKHKFLIGGLRCQLCPGIAGEQLQQNHDAG